MKIRFTSPPQQANAQNGLPLRYAAARRQIPRLRWYLLVLLVSVPLLYLALRVLLGAWWDTSPGVVNLAQGTLKAEHSGRLVWQVHAGEAVDAGAVLAHIYPDQGATALAVDSVLPLARQALAQRAAQAQWVQAQAQTQWALAQQARLAQRLVVVNRLIQQGAATQAEQAQAEAQVAAAWADVLRAKAGAQAVQDTLGTLALERHAAASPALPPAPAQAQAVVATAAGMVVRQLAIDQAWVPVGADLLQLQWAQEPEIRVFINPADAAHARIGQKADLAFLDGGTLTATVTKVEADTARLPPDRVGPLTTRLQSIVAVLQPDRPLPQKYRIGDLPVDVQFHRLRF